MTKGWANGSKFGAEHEIDIDIRSGGIIVGPGSKYELDERSKLKKPHKVKYIGEQYKLVSDAPIAPLPEIFVQWRKFGMNKETMEIMPAKVSLKRSKRLCDDIIDRDTLGELLKEIRDDGVYQDDRDSWRAVGYCVAALCDLNEFGDAGDIFDEFSQQYEAYGGRWHCDNIISSYSLEKTSIPLSRLLHFVSKDNPLR